MNKAIRRLLSGGIVVVLLSVLPVASAPGGRAARHERLVPTFQRLHAEALVTAPAKADWDFATVGISWRRSEGFHGRAAVRTSANGTEWSDWTELEPRDNGPDPGSVEDTGIDSSEPLWVRRARFAQLRWSSGLPPRSLAVHFIDPGSDATSPGATALAAPVRPDIISRAQWGADESIRRCCPTFAPSVDFAVVHHTATTNSYTPDEAKQVVRSIYEYHVKVNGWADIGYHFLIDRFGRTYEGRYGGITKPVIGAHSDGFNTGSTGVAIMGNFSSSAPTSASMTALRELLAWKLDAHHVDPRSTVTVVSRGSKKWPAGASVHLHAISGHRDVQETACPGDRLYAALPQLRTDAYAIGLPKIFKPRVSPGVFAPSAGGTAHITATTSGAQWLVRVLGGGTVVRSWSGSGNLDIRWDGKDAAGRLVPHGYYKVELSGWNGDEPATPATLSLGVYRDPWASWTQATTPLSGSSAPEVAPGPSGTFHLLARDGVGAVLHWRWSDGVWGTGSRLGSSTDVAATQGRLGFVFADGVLHAVIRGRNSNIYHGRIQSNGSFTGWQRIGDTGDRGTDLAVAVDHSGVVHVLIVGMSGNLYANRYSGGWSSWKRVGGSDDKGMQPAMVTGRGGDVLAVVVSAGSAVYANKLDPGRGWRTHWSYVGKTDGRGVEPVVAAVGEGFLVLVRGASTPNIWQSTGTIGSWSSWSRVGSTSDTGYEPAAIDAQGDVVLVVRGRTSGRIFANIRAPDGGWRGWDEAGDSLQSGALPALAANGQRVMLAAQVNGDPPATVVATPPLRSR
jgi:hypothetical protein